MSQKDADRDGTESRIWAADDEKTESNRHAVGNAITWSSAQTAILSTVAADPTPDGELRAVAWTALKAT